MGERKCDRKCERKCGRKCGQKVWEKVWTESVTGGQPFEVKPLPEKVFPHCIDMVGRVGGDNGGTTHTESSPPSPSPSSHAVVPTKLLPS